MRVPDASCSARGRCLEASNSVMTTLALPAEHRRRGTPVVFNPQAGNLHLNSTHLVRGGRTELLPKRGIWEAEMAEPATQAAVCGTGQTLCCRALTRQTFSTITADPMASPVPQLRSQCLLPRRSPTTTILYTGSHCCARGLAWSSSPFRSIAANRGCSTPRRRLSVLSCWRTRRCGRWRASASPSCA